MIRIANYKLSATKILLIVICVLYITFLLIDLSIIKAFALSSLLKYISIILCFLISSLIGNKYIDRTDKLLLQLGLFFTLISDFFLLFTDYFTIGVGVFSIVHIIYTIRYEKNRIKPVLIKFTVIFLIIIITYLMLSFFFIEIELLFAIAFFYAISILNSVIKAIKACKYELFPNPNKYLIAFGMALFLLCDINVGIFNITRMAYSSNGIINLLYSISGVLMWFFYLPSQVLLSLSGFDFKHLHKN